MEGPGQDTTLEMVNKSLCVLTMLLGPSLIPGLYQCGSVLPSNGEQTEYALFAAFNTSTAEMGTVGRVEHTNTSGYEKASVTYLPEETDSTQPTTTREAEIPPSVTSVILIILGLSASVLCTALTYMTIKYVRTRRYEWSSPPTRRSASFSGRSYGSYYSYYQPSNKLRRPELTTHEDPTIEFPPPMDLIPADSIARYIQRCPPTQQTSCACPKKPFSPLEQFV